MAKTKIKIRMGKKGKIEVELDTDNLLIDIRKELLDQVLFPFIFLDEDENPIPKNEETNKKLKDVLDGRNLYLKKEIIKRTMLGENVPEKKGKNDGLTYYVYPQIELSEEEKNCSSNIMVIGETGVGKSTWLHCFINYLQGIQIEEKNRYYLFDEKKLQDKYNKEHPGQEKTSGASVTDTPAIYNVKPTNAFNNPIRLIDTAGFGDVRGEEYDKKITEDINNLFTNEIENLHAICLLFKATETRAHDRAKKVLDKLFSLFGDEIKKNIIIIFTFVEDFNDIPTFNTLTDAKSPFFTILGDIKNLPHFEFNNKAYFSTEIDKYTDAYDNNTKNFGKLLKYVFQLKKISLESSRQVIKNRFEITNYISNVCRDLSEVIKNLYISFKNRSYINELKTKLESKKESPYRQITVTKQREEQYMETYSDYCSDGWYVLYCRSCCKVCHNDCKGPNEGMHSSEYGCDAIGTLSRKCSYCKCHYEKHSFRNYVEKTRIATRIITYDDREDDPNSVLDEKEKAKQREEISKEIKQKENEVNNLDNQIHVSLNESLDKLSLIASKEKDLNKIALKKYENEKYGYCKKVLNENIKEKNIKNVFTKTLDDIDSIC